MLLAVAFGYYKGRNAAVVSGQSLTWTQIPLIALAIISIGPSILAVVLYFAYTFGIIQPGPRGFRFSQVFIFGSPVEFALINWPFVALYLVCRIWPNLGGARLAMWFSVVAMTLPNVVLFGLAPEMVSNARDAGQGIGVIEAMLSFPVIPIMIISALTAPIPLIGLAGWLVGQSVGRFVSATHPKKNYKKN